MSRPIRLRGARLPKPLRAKLPTAPGGPTMNGLEASFAALLDARQRSGEIVRFGFEEMKLRLGEKCFYTPDFNALLPSGEFVFYEAKGFWRDDARVKIKAAASRYPMFKFIAVQRKRGGFVYEEIKS